MYFLYFVVHFWLLLQVNADTLDRYSGVKVDELRAKKLRDAGIYTKCTIEVKQCGPHEGSRVDGTCNNFKYPSTGAARGPYLRLLTPDVRNDTATNDTTKVKAISTLGLPSARSVRTSLLHTGRVDDKTTFTVAAPHYLQFIDTDLSALSGPYDFLKSRKHCCTSEGENDARCTPVRVPEDDPYLKVTDIRCLNFSAAETFQLEGCIHDVNTPQQINFQTPLLDLSTIYGVDNEALQRVRHKENGLLKMEERNGRLFPTTTNASQSACLFQDGKLCYNFGFPEAGNTDIRTLTFNIFFMREHNRIAQALHKLNPCWKDDRLFKVARQVNIAAASNIFMYELLPPLLGENNMLNFGLISDTVEYIRAYDEDAVPLVYAEYEVAIRMFRTMMDGRIKKYDENLHYKGELSLSDTLFKANILEEGHNFEEINRGTFLQNAARIDDVIDPEISEKFYASIEKAHDLSADDIQRARELGVQGYNKYRKLCGLTIAQGFEDLTDVMDVEKIETLKKLYKTVDDIELLPGIMSENHIAGTFVGPIMLCIMAKQLQALRYTDRFWFERGGQVHSLTLPQLHEIRRANMARFVCDNAEGISFMQPRAFLNVRPGNTPIPCEHIAGPDLTRWQDSSCDKKSPKQTATPWKVKQSHGGHMDLWKIKQIHEDQPKNWNTNQIFGDHSMNTYNISVSYSSNNLQFKPLLIQ